MPQVVHSDSTRANIAKVAPRILEKVRPDRNPHSLFAAAQIIFHDDSRDLPPLANPGPQAYAYADHREHQEGVMACLEKRPAAF